MYVAAFCLTASAVVIVNELIGHLFLCTLQAAVAVMGSRFLACEASYGVCLSLCINRRHVKGYMVYFCAFGSIEGAVGGLVRYLWFGDVEVDVDGYLSKGM